MKSVDRNQGFTEGGRSELVLPGHLFERANPNPKKCKYLKRNWQFTKIFSLPRVGENPWPIILTYFYNFLRPAVGILPGLKMYTPVVTGLLCASGRNGIESVRKSLSNTTTSADIAANILSTISEDESPLDDSIKRKRATISSWLTQH